MKRLFGFVLAVLVNVMLVGVFAASLQPTPNGDVVITELTDGAEVTVASR